MKKYKVRLSLIDDYIKIYLINNFCNNDFLGLEHSFLKKIQQIEKLDSILKKIYDKLFKQLKLEDISLLILKKELTENNLVFEHLKQKNYQSLPLVLNYYDNELNDIFKSLGEKLKLLKINNNWNLFNFG